MFLNHCVSVLFVTLVDDWKLLTNVMKKSILDVSGLICNVPKKHKKLLKTAFHKYTVFSLRYNNSFLAATKYIYCLAKSIY